MVDEEIRPALSCLIGNPAGARADAIGAAYIGALSRQRGAHYSLRCHSPNWVARGASTYGRAQTSALAGFCAAAECDQGVHFTVRCDSAGVDGSGIRCAPSPRVRRDSAPAL